MTTVAELRKQLEQFPDDWVIATQRYDEAELTDENELLAQHILFGAYRTLNGKLLISYIYNDSEDMPKDFELTQNAVYIA